MLEKADRIILDKIRAIAFPYPIRAIFHIEREYRYPIESKETARANRVGQKRGPLASNPEIATNDDGGERWLQEHEVEMSGEARGTMDLLCSSRVSVTARLYRLTRNTTPEEAHEHHTYTLTHHTNERAYVSKMHTEYRARGCVRVSFPSGRRKKLWKVPGGSWRAPQGETNDGRNQGRRD